MSFLDIYKVKQKNSSIFFVKAVQNGMPSKLSSPAFLRASWHFFAICFNYFHVWHLRAHYKHQVSVSTDSLSKIQGRLLNCKGFFEGHQWQNARLPPRCDLSPLKTENGVERIRRCDLLWKPRTISIVCAFLLFLHLPCRDKRAQHAGNCDGNYNPAVLPSLIS